MSFWTEIHWSEGMFLRPHHLQASQRWMETVVRTGFDAVRPFGWGFVDLSIASEPLENFTLRLDGCNLRLKDGTWVRVPENTQLAPLNFENALSNAGGTLRIFLGVPEMQAVRANAVSLENPETVEGSPRYEPHPVMQRDENTGGNPQMVYVRRMRGRLFTEGEGTTGYETVPLCAVRKTDKPGAVPELEVTGAGPLLSIQADVALSGMVTSLADQVEAKGEVLAREAREHQMMFTDGVASNTEHLLKLNALNELRAHLAALLQCPVLHPYDVFIAFSRLVGALSVYHDDLVPQGIPAYDHDRPGVSLDTLRRRIIILLEAVRALNYVSRPFARKKDRANRDGLEVELDRQWIDDNLEMYVAFQSEEMDINELERYIYNKLNLKLASPTRAPRIASIAVRGLRLQIKSVPSGTLPRRPGLHYFKIDKTIGQDRTDYWRECEQERGIRMGIPEGQLAAIEKYKPTLYVPLRSRS
ncbi:MAG: type VI secretion system baseplate subunit TssK [Phycisphaerales bacterium]|nr:MAG: type VI secretion system baseplate subunit TssK [Phycisphaerales bacterium]